ncbi:MAG: SDR family oxidoreductase [Chloroflexi bacterium]|nr:SDR family oxidoreductase [Chloroflexota bacterium]OJV92339.1 MAG: hypothetical protein BGO39_30875 [Chloroflexi bacterium 54-19]
MTLTKQSALVTGGSRGIGAATVLALAKAGLDVAFTFRSKQKRADQVVQEASIYGGRVLALKSDMTNPEDRADLLQTLSGWTPNLNYLVLNASGGLEQDLTQADPDYAVKINRDAQVAFLSLFLPGMPEGSTVAFITSHWAHLYGQVEQIPSYEPVARSKHLGEQAIRKIMDETRPPRRLLVVTGDLIEGTITPKLLERSARGLTGQRRDEIGELPTAAEMGQVIVNAMLDPHLESGRTLVVGGALNELLD